MHVNNDSHALLESCKGAFIYLGKRAVKVVKENPVNFSIYLAILTTAIVCFASPYVSLEIKLWVGIPFGLVHLAVLMREIDDYLSGAQNVPFDYKKSDYFDDESFTPPQWASPSSKSHKDEKHNPYDVFKARNVTEGFASYLPKNLNTAEKQLLDDLQVPLNHKAVKVVNGDVIITIREKGTEQIFSYTLRNMGDEWHCDGFSPIPRNPIDRNRHPLFEKLNLACISSSLKRNGCTYKHSAWELAD